jgi:hypothetical protein
MGDLIESRLPGYPLPTILPPCASPLQWIIQSVFAIEPLYRILETEAFTPATPWTWYFIIRFETKQSFPFDADVNSASSLTEKTPRFTYGHVTCSYKPLSILSRKAAF